MLVPSCGYQSVVYSISCPNSMAFCSTHICSACLHRLGCPGWHSGINARHVRARFHGSQCKQTPAHIKHRLALRLQTANVESCFATACHACVNCSVHCRASQSAGPDREAERGVVHLSQATSTSWRPAFSHTPGSYLNFEFSLLCSGLSLRRSQGAISQFGTQLKRQRGSLHAPHRCLKGCPLPAAAPAAWPFVDSVVMLAAEARLAAWDGCDTHRTALRQPLSTRAKLGGVSGCEASRRYISFAARAMCIWTHVA